MRYHIRQRGKDDVIGPFSLEEIMGRVRAGQLNPWHMVLIDSGQTPEQLRSHSDFKWEPLEGLFAAANNARAVASVSQVSPADEHRQAVEARRAVANGQMLWGAIICIIGIVVTVGSYSMAAESRTGGTYVIAWGAIVFGFIRFLSGLSLR